MFAGGGLEVFQGFFFVAGKSDSERNLPGRDVLLSGAGFEVIGSPPFDGSFATLFPRFAGGRGYVKFALQLKPFFQFLLRFLPHALQPIGLRQILMDGIDRSGVPETLCEAR